MRFGVIILTIVLIISIMYIIWHQLNIVSGTGTITYLDFEGGFYGIVSDDEEHYDPDNLSEEFQVDGLRVHFELSIIEGMSHIHQWGKYASIIRIQILE